MSQIAHLQANRKILDTRFALLRATREWFWSQGFTEVETPTIVRCPDQEPSFFLMKTEVHNERGEAFTGFLHTSPEYAEKKMLAAGYDKIFFLGKVFRDHESFGGTHNPEFTMIEWYRVGGDYRDLMDDVEALFKFVLSHIRITNLTNSTNVRMYESTAEFKRMHMRELWREFVQVNLDEYLTAEPMRALCIARGYEPAEQEGYEDLFYRIFLNEIEPKLPALGPVMIHHYPLPMAALSRPSAVEPGYAERVEAYIDGIELANGFSELTDATEQRRRLEHERARRIQLGKQVFPIDEDFIEAVGAMPTSAGIALGFDRLVQIVTGCQNIDSVLPFPASKLF